MLIQSDFVQEWISGGQAASEKLAALMDRSTLAYAATEGLAICCEAITRPAPEVLAVVEAGRTNWAQGHDAFDAVRALTIMTEQSQQEEPAFLILYVAENAAKVIYNASSPDDPFDDDSGAWFFMCVSHFLRSLDDVCREKLTHALGTPVRSKLG